MTLSEDLFEQAREIIPGGVSSPVRAFKAVGGSPLFFKEGIGPYLVDVDDKRYIDYVGSWGPLILGHRHPAVVAAIKETLDTGVSFGAPIEAELKLAHKIIKHMPSIEMVRMVNSGTEATMTAIRLARGFTKRDKIIKFVGCYHGHSDSLLVKAGSGALTHGVPSSPGVPDSVVKHTLTADFNDLEQVEALFKQHKEDIAAVIVEPIAGNMGFILPQPGFLSGLRSLCDRYQSLLIFDEVMTGFRVALGGAQKVYDIKPDLTTLGKIIGGGLPVGALGGRAEVMSCLSPLGPVYQAGTLSGNPLAMAAGYATLSEIEKEGFYEQLSNKTDLLINGLMHIANYYKVPFKASSLGGMFGFCFTEKEQLVNYKDVAASDESLFKRFFHDMLQKGIYLAPSLFEAGFVSSEHQSDEINQTLVAVESFFAQL